METNPLHGYTELDNKKTKEESLSIDRFKTLANQYADPIEQLFDLSRSALLDTTRLSASAKLADIYLKLLEKAPTVVPFVIQQMDLSNILHPNTEKRTDELQQ